MGRLWEPLYPSIKKLLGRSRVLRTWEKQSAKEPSQLRYVMPMSRYGGRPILKDLPDEVYLAPNYNYKHRAALEGLGVKNLDWDMKLDRLRADLVNPRSELKTRLPHDGWHEALAKMLLPTFESSNLLRVANNIKRLAIIPLIGKNGVSRWTGAPGISAGGLDDIYFPSTESVPIPEDISLHLVERTAASGTNRKKLYSAMGVKDCLKQTVISHIQKSHRLVARPGPSIHDPISHFVYLYNFHPSPESIKEWVQVPVEGDELRSTSKPLFFPSENEYDTQQLLPKEMRGQATDVAAFIIQSLLDAVPPDTRRKGLSWMEWLQKATGARFFPPLTDTTRERSLSDTLFAVYKNNSTKFIGTLQAHWNEYSRTVYRVSSDLKALPVACESGEKISMESTYLPTPEIKAKLKQWNIQFLFPLIKLPIVLDSTNHREWVFLKELGVKASMDLEFFKIALTMLSHLIVYPNLNTVRQVYVLIAQHATMQHREDLK